MDSHKTLQGLLCLSFPIMHTSTCDQLPVLPLKGCADDPFCCKNPKLQVTLWCIQGHLAPPPGSLWNSNACDKSNKRVSQIWIHPFSSRARLRFWKSTIFSRSGAFSYISINKGKLSFSSSYLQSLSIVMHAKLALSSLLGDLLPFLLLFVGKKLLCCLKCHDWMIVPDSAECEKDDWSLRNLKFQAETK